MNVAGAPAVVEVDDLPGASESEPNDEPSQATSLPVPGVGDGRVGRAGDVDVWALAFEKGQSYVLDVRAARLGSNLDALLSLTDPGGKEVARAEGRRGTRRRPLTDVPGSGRRHVPRAGP